jgi:DNA-binding CsgD family transcriptional regulator
MGKIKIDRDFTKNRSDRYQHVLVEASCSPDMLAEFSDSRGLAGHLNAVQNNEEMHDLKAQLKAARWRIIRSKLTPRQCEVIEHYAAGMTQIEIAKKLDVNQSSITKSINGNCDYRNGKKVYGGAKKKLRRLEAQDEEIQIILERMSEIQSEQY